MHILNIYTNLNYKLRCAWYKLIGINRIIIGKDLAQNVNVKKYNDNTIKFYLNLNIYFVNFDNFLHENGLKIGKISYTVLMYNYMVLWYMKYSNITN